MNRRMVKRINTTASVLGLILGAAACFYFAGNYESHYKVSAKVVSTNSNVVSIVDSRDETWEFEGTNFKAGDDVIVKFYDNNTRTVYDDKIVEVKHAKA